MTKFKTTTFVLQNSGKQLLVQDMYDVTASGL